MAKKKKQSQSFAARKGLTPSEAQTRQGRLAFFIGIALIVTLLIVSLYTIPAFRRTLNKIISSFENGEPQTELASFPPPKQVVKKSEIEFADFVGSEACRDCHLEQYEQWKTSTHGRAGGEPGNTKIIAKFNRQPLVFKDATVIPLINAAGEYVFRVEYENKAAEEFKVAAVVGGGHMAGGGTQSYFAKFPDGTLKFLPFDFIRAENIWFAQLRNDGSWTPVSRDISLGDLAQWPPHRILGSDQDFSNCQNCHGSQIIAQYDSSQKKYATKYQTLQIDCESCHGPGRRHIELAASENFDALEDIGMQALSTFAKDQSLKICFQCHATKDAIRNDYLPGKRLEDYYSLKLPILGSSPYLADGRVREFAYQENHLFSDCYLNGSMTCVDCHDPHSQKYRDGFGNALKGRFDNGQCVGCHASKAQTATQHSHHREGSPGNLCTSCHMPYLQHKLVGNWLKFARSDHTIPIPRPAFDAGLGIESACKKCHQDKTDEWLQKKVDEWHGKTKPHHPSIEKNLQARNTREIKETAELLLNPQAQHSMAQVMGLSDFIKRFLRPDMTGLDQAIVGKLRALAENDDLDISALALMALHLSAGNDRQIRSFLIDALQKMGGRETAIRARWANSIDYLGVVFVNKKEFANAIRAHEKALEIMPDDPITLTNLGVAYQSQGDYRSAIDAYKKALQRKPQAWLYLQVSHLHEALGEIPEALAALRDWLRYDPTNEEARQSLARLQGQ